LQPGVHQPLGLLAHGLAAVVPGRPCSPLMLSARIQLLAVRLRLSEFVSALADQVLTVVDPDMRLVRLEGIDEPYNERLGHASGDLSTVQPGYFGRLHIFPGWGHVRASSSTATAHLTLGFMLAGMPIQPGH
jgi:hypothetical protein